MILFKVVRVPFAHGGPVEGKKIMNMDIAVVVGSCSRSRDSTSRSRQLQSYQL